MTAADMIIPADQASDLLAKVRTAGDDAVKLQTLAYCSERIAMLFRDHQTPDAEDIESIWFMSNAVHNAAVAVVSQIDGVRFILDKIADAKEGA